MITSNGSMVRAESVTFVGLKLVFPCCFGNRNAQSVCFYVQFTSVFHVLKVFSVN